MGDSIDLLQPYGYSFAGDDDEQALKEIFTTVFNELFGDQIRDIHSYGMPHWGSANVVERFTKQDGLVVVRRPTASNLIMRIIYANWKSLSSRRGLSFLEFVLQMIWANQWQINRLYHSTERIFAYPSLSTPDQTLDSFLTSRITITINQDVDVQEILELSPMISKLVPANIVAKVASGLDLGDTAQIGIAAGCMLYAAQNLEYFGDVGSIQIPWTDWIVGRNFEITKDIVKFDGFKTDLIQVVRSHAFYNLRTLALTLLKRAEFQAMTGVWYAVLVIHEAMLSIEFDTPNSLIKVLIMPEVTDELAVADVLLARLKASGDEVYAGKTSYNALISFMKWIYQANGIYKAVPADISITQTFAYSANDNVLSYDSFLDAAQKQVADMVQTEPTWAEYVLGDLVLDSETTETVVYIQNYEHEDTQQQYMITVNLIDNPNFVSESAVSSVEVPPEDLHNIIALVREKAEIEGNTAIEDTIAQAIKSAYSKDATYTDTNTLYDSALVDLLFSDAVNQIFENMSASGIQYSTAGGTYRIAAGSGHPAPVVAGWRY
jgi:hypothetical protein